MIKSNHNQKLRNMTSNHQGAVKNAIGKQIKVREFLEDLRIIVMKNYSIGKMTRITDITLKHKVSGSSGLWLEAIGAIKDHTPAGTLKRDGKKMEWCYKGNPDGVVDEKLVQALIQKEQDYGKQKRALAKEGSQLIVKTLVENGHVKLPTSRTDKLDQIKAWFQDQLEKHEKIGDYLRPQTVVMYNRVIEMMTGLEELSAAIKKVNL